MENEEDYWIGRARETRARGDASDDKNVRAIHEELARLQDDAADAAKKDDD